MRLLFDQNLSRRLVVMLAVEYPGSRHVAELGLDTATDRAIWDYAGEHGFMIVSKDSDFRQLAFLLGPPPKAIWVRVGNVSTLDILSVLQQYRQAVEIFASTADEALLVLPRGMEQ
ncbi:MAG: hypothetical protein F4Z00_08095 [Acidimicrobiaceae bacterium]|nr:DUF5615 family PIN-like protein [Acidimicrobiaceae bacterium]MXW97097.1 hypothetical protein [Acidimicrobiaceae bacterium]MXY09615.1 hypothetical protein [Acidimicrobiaceae bacterium]MXZ65497.1 hypothetical protein [Acidimicrobiaceae bacterium]MYG78579.1 hypothetical protein [Acidimicrobiaceae bacterium]